MWTKLLGVIIIGFDVTYQLLIFYAFVKYWRKNGCIVHMLLIDFKKAYGLVKGEVLYNILIEFGVSLKLVRLIKMRLNKTYSKVGICEIYRIRFLFQMIWSKEMLCRHYFLTLLYNVIRKI
jgi:hypothetical protein